MQILYNSAKKKKKDSTADQNEPTLKSFRRC